MKIDFRKIIKKRMKKRHINIPQLARIININQQTLYNYLAGRSELTAGNLQKIFNFFKIKFK